MRFRIIGTHRGTGDAVRMIVDAADQEEAERWAAENQITWTQVEPVDEFTSSPMTQLAQAVAASSATRVTRSHAPAVHSAGFNVPPSGGVAYMHQTFIAPQKGANPLGIASLVMGIIAAVTAWIPLCGMTALPIGGLGIVLGCLGFLVAAIGRRSGVGYPVAGCIVCALAMTVAIASTNHATKKLLADLSAQLRTNQQVVEEYRPDGNAGDKQPTNTGESDAERWAPASNAVRQGDVEVKVDSATVGPVSLRQQFSNGPGESPEPLLIIKVRVRNLSQTKKLDYRSWAGQRVSFTRDFATVQDNFGNVYKRIDFGFGTTPVGAVEVESIYPGTYITDTLVFEPPIDKTEHLKLELPGQNFGGTGQMRILIPATMLGR